MKCANCNKEITDDFIPAANSNFCSEICHLRFWKEDMPNLGGQLITAESLEKLAQLNGQAQKDEYTRIVQFVIDNFESTPFMRLLQDEK